MVTNSEIVIFFWVILTTVFIVLFIRNFTKVVIAQRLWFAKRINLKLFTILILCVVLPVTGISIFSYLVVQQIIIESINSSDIQRFTVLYKYLESKIKKSVPKIKKFSIRHLKNSTNICIKSGAGFLYGRCNSVFKNLNSNLSKGILIINGKFYVSKQYKDTQVYLEVKHVFVKHYLMLREKLERFQAINQNQKLLLLNYLLNLVFWIVLAVFGSLWIATFLGKNFTTFLNSLVNAIDSASKGDLSIKLGRFDSLELDFIGRKFNYMMSQLKYFQHSIEEKQKELEAVVNNCGVGIGIFEKNYLTFKNIFLESILTKLSIEKLHSVILESISNFSEKELEIPKTVSRILSVDTTIFSVFVTIVDARTNKAIISIRDVTDLVDKERGILLKDLLSKISHEVKNPLMPIESKLKKLLESNPTPEIEDVYSRFINFKRLLMELISSVKLQNIKISQFSLPELIYELVNNIPFSSKAVDFIITNEHGLDKVETDRVIVSLALKNVLENAFNFAVEGSSVEVSIHLEDLYVAINVINQGPDIPHELRDRIFEPYFTTTKSGTGLGLYLSRTVLNSIGGEIKLIKSNDGETIFKIKFPKISDQTVAFASIV